MVPDYAVVVDPATLACPTEVSGEVRLLVAARVGPVRLIDNLGATAALTGPARRGDWATLSRHLDALPEGERPGYQAGAALATRLAGSAVPVVA